MWEINNDFLAHQQKASDLEMWDDPKVQDFYTKLGIVGCVVHRKNNQNPIGTNLRPTFCSVLPSPNAPQLLRPVQEKLSWWIRRHGYSFTEFLKQEDHFCLKHSLGVQSPDRIEGNSLELATALSLLTEELNLSVSGIWGATGELLEAEDLLVGEVSDLEKKTLAFFREFPEGSMLLPKCSKAVYIQRERPKQVILVASFSEAVFQIFDKQLVKEQLENRQHRSAFEIWLELTQGYEKNRAHADKKLGHWRVVEKNRTSLDLLSQEAQAYRTASYLLYAVHTGESLKPVEQDLPQALSFFKKIGLTQLANRMQNLWYNSKLDNELDYDFLRLEVKKNKQAVLLLPANQSRLGWWSMLLGKVQKDQKSQECYYQLAEHYFLTALEKFDKQGMEACRKAHTMNHYAELCLLRFRIPDAECLVRKSKDLFESSPNESMKHHNKPYWAQLQMRIDNKQGNYSALMCRKIDSSYVPLVKGFLQTEKLRAQIGADEDIGQQKELGCSYRDFSKT